MWWRTLCHGPRVCHNVAVLALFATDWFSFCRIFKLLPSPSLIFMLIIVFLIIIIPISISIIIMTIMIHFIHKI